MRLRILLAATFGTMLLLVPSPASAKGPTEAELTGPGLDEPIRLDDVEHRQSSVAELVSEAGVFEAFGYPAQLELATEPPTEELGSRYVATYGSMFPEEVPQDLEVRQELYPFAQGGPVVYTPPGQSMYGTQTTNGGWRRADPRLTELLVSLGVPTPQQLQTRRAPSVEDRGRDMALIAGFSGAAVVAGFAVVLVAGVVRRRTRRATAPSES